jgi:hypothetical protein
MGGRNERARGCRGRALAHRRGAGIDMNKKERRRSKQPVLCAKCGEVATPGHMVKISTNSNGKMVYMMCFDTPAPKETTSKE